MAHAPVDLDLDALAKHLKARMEERGLSIRAAASEIGCSHATLGRLLQGTKGGSTPDSVNLIRAASWVGKSLGDLSGPHATVKSSSVADVEVHLRAIPGLAKPDADAILALVKAAISARTRKPSR